MRWLNDYVKADMPIKEFVADMTMSGSKVETYHNMHRHKQMAAILFLFRPDLQEILLRLPDKY